MKRMKKLAAIFLTIALLATMIPSGAFAASSLSGTFNEGTIVKSSDGGTYQFSKSEAGTISIYYYDTASGSVKVFNGQVDSATEPKRTYTIKTTSGTYRGYCVEHGVHTDGSKNIKTLSEEKIDEIIYAGLSETARDNLELALFYGYQFGDNISKLTKSVGEGGLGFADSKYYGKNSSTGYDWGDWYMATQCIIWEIQQRNRTDSMERVTNDLDVSGNHYLSIVSGRPAVDIYNWMVSCIKNHYKFPSTIDGKDKDTPDTIKLTEDNKVEGGYEYTFKDSTNAGLDYGVYTTKGKKVDNVTITYNESTKDYTLKVTGEPTDDVLMVKHNFNGVDTEDDLLYWCWYSNGSHVQAIATGATDPVQKYIKLTSNGEGDDSSTGEGNERPEPEYVPTFEMPIEKIDENPGWDGDVHTGMGDASLGATYKLYRAIDGGAEELIDTITLDEWGTQQSFYDTPWSIEDIKASLYESESLTHEETDDEGNVTHSCTVEPLKAEWSAEVSYRIVEERPAGRFIEPDTGVRTCTASYYAVTTNSQACADEPENWSDITYTVEAEPSSEAPVTGLKDEMPENIKYDGENFLFVNDEYRGRIFLSKSNENDDVFNEEGTAGSQEKSTNSKWKVKLQSGGWEGQPYISFVDEGLDRTGTHVYRVVRDTSGTDNATTDLTIGTNGCLYIYDLPYGTYLVEEVAADDTSYVLESFVQFIDEHNNGYYPNDEEKDNRYDWQEENKKKENVIKVVKTDAETGKTVSAENLKNAKFYIRYMGSPLSEDPTKDANYGRLLPNAADINSTSKDYTFTCNDNGEIVIPYDLEFGVYRLEEWLLPEGYFVGEYNENGVANNHDYDVLAEGQTKVLSTNDMYDKLVTIYDAEGNPVEYKDGSEYKLNEVFNYYTFEVTKQNGHLDGTEYEKYYQAVAMANTPVKGKIVIEKSGEVLTGFKEEKVNGQTVMKPVYEAVEKVKGAIYGIYAAVDEWLNDGNDGATIYDAETDEEIIIPTTKSTHEGNLFETIKGALSDFFFGSGDVYETGEMEHSSGAKLWFLKDRDASEDGEYTRMYLTPEQKPTSYTYSYEKSENGINYRYDVEVLMEYKAGGKNVTDVNVTKITSVANGYLASLDEFITTPTGTVGNTTVSMDENYESTNGNILDAFNNNFLYHADGEKVYDAEGNETRDLGEIGVTRYTAIDYVKYELTDADVAKTQVELQPGVDNNNDGKFDGLGEDNNNDGDYDDAGVDNNGNGVYTDEGDVKPDVKPDVAPVTEERTNFEAANFGTNLKTGLVAPAAGGQTVKAVFTDANGNDREDEGEVTYFVLTDGYYQNAVYVEAAVWVPCDGAGNIVKEYTIPEGWTETTFTGNVKEEPHYVIITKDEPVMENGQQVGTETLYKVLLSDKTTWLDCQPNGDFEKLYEQVYDVTYTQVAGNEEGFTLTWDGITVASTAMLDNTATTTIANPFTVTPEIDLGIGYSQETVENTTTFTAKEPSAPIYFKTADGVKTEMYYFGGLTKTILTIPMRAVEANFEYVVPMITFGEGEDAQIIDWFSELSPDNPVFEKTLLANNTLTAERHEGADGEDVYYTVTIISDQKMATAGDELVAGERPFSIIYSDGYTARIYCAESAEGNGLGVLELGGVYKTNRYSTSELVATLTTDANGHAESQLLPLGTYIVRELSAPEGYVTDDTSYVVNLEYKDQFTPLIWGLVKAKNEAVSVEIDLAKVFETAAETGNYVPSDGAVFGLYSAETIKSTNANAELVAEIPVDTLMDIIKVDENGKAKSKIKLPFGTYYIQEIATKSGYYLNDTPFYFIVNETADDTSTPCEFEYTSDGIKGNVVMDSYGKATIRIETQVRYPAPSIIVNGTEYPLDTEAANDLVTVETEKDVTVLKVSAKDGEDVKITLPNGKYVNVTVKGNLYEYEINGTKATFTPNVSYTGYFAGYEHEFTYVEPDQWFNPIWDWFQMKGAGEDATYIYGTIQRTPVTKTEKVWEDADKDNVKDEGEEKDVTKAVLDKNGKQTYTHLVYINAWDKAGTNRIADNTYTRINEEGTTTETLASAYDTITVNQGDTITFKDTQGAQISVLMDEKGKMEVQFHDTTENAITDGNSPSVKWNDVDDAENLVYAKNETLARQDAAAKTIQIKVNSLDNVAFEVTPIENDKIPVKTPTPTPGGYTPTPSVPSIRTTAVDSETNDHISKADGKVTIVDSVSYYNLTVGKEYTMKGVLTDKATGEPLLVDGKTITAEKVFTPTTANGIVEIEFKLDAEDLAGKTTVVFEECYINTDADKDGKPDKETPVAEHEDIYDEGQTVYFPSIGTTAVDSDTNNHVSNADDVITIIDTVTYENLIPNREYVMKGTLMNAETGKAVKVDGEKVTAEMAFVPEYEDGTVEMKFVFDGTDKAGLKTVVFEELFIMVDTNGDGDTDKEEPVAEHKDIEDEGQTVYIPEIGTKASLSEDGKIIDIVEIENLLPGATYTMSGILMDKATGEPVIVDGKTVTSERTFIVKKEDGKVKMEFEIDADALAGKTTVVFEQLYVLVDTDEDGKLDSKEPVADHKNINDKEQTVKIPATPKEPVTHVPETGDNSPIIPWAMAMMLSAIAGIGFVAGRRKEER